MRSLGEHAEYVWALFGAGNMSALSSGSGDYEPMAYPGDPGAEFSTDGDVAEMSDSTTSMSGAPRGELGTGPEYVYS